MTTCLLISHDEIVFFDYLTVGRPQKTDLLLISSHCQESFLSCAAVTDRCYICSKANSQVPRVLSQKVGVSQSGRLFRGFPSWKRA